METYHYDTPRGDLGITRSKISPDATPREAAAIASALSAYLDSTAGDDDPEGDAAIDERWRYAGRIEQITGRSVGVPRSLPTSAWVAAGRLPRV